MAIERFDKSNLKNIRSLLERTLASALQKHGLTASLGNITFSPTDFRVTLSVATGSGDDVLKRNWDKYCRLYGFEPEDFGKTFVQGLNKYTICDIKPKSRKYPIIAKREDGSRYKFSTNNIKMLGLE